MRSFHPSARHSLIGAAAILASTLIAPQTLLAQTANTAYGFGALTPNTGSYNSAFGYYSLYYNVSGYENTAIGAQTLFANSTGYNNSALGVNALYSNSTGYSNSAFGVNALVYNTGGYENAAVGANALSSNTEGVLNTAIGVNALFTNTTGGYNTASGYRALGANTTGYYNTANGIYALSGNTTGSNNTATGMFALSQTTMGDNNTAIGGYTLSENTTGFNNIAVGYFAGNSVTTGGYNIDIGNNGTSTDNGIVRIGTSGNQKKTFIAGISGVRSTGGVQVYINSAGQLGTLTSSQRFKKDIKSIDGISDKLLQLRPVSFIYKEDDKSELQYGLIAEEVAKIYPELVQYDADGKPFTVYYHLLTPLLLSELQKEHQKIDTQETELASLNQQLTTQHAEMLAMQQQQKQQLAAMAVLQQKLVQLDDLLQANNSKALPSEKVALVPTH